LEGHHHCCGLSGCSIVFLSEVEAETMRHRRYIFCLSASDTLYPKRKARWIEEALEANELGLALEYILEYKREI
jgi:hypothetical protein